jgi:6-phosphogluconolactonase
VCSSDLPGSTVAETLLYLTSSTDLSPNPIDNTVSEYSVDSSGNVAEKTGSPYVTGGTVPSAVQAVDTNPAGGNGGGLFVYVTNQTTNNVSVFQVCIVPNGSNNCLTQQDVQNATMSAVGSPVGVGQAPIALAADPTNNFLYVVCETSNQVFAFRIGTVTGELSPLNAPFLGTGSLPVAMAMHPTGTFLYLYVSNNASSNLSGFTVNTTSGALSNPITVISLGQPAGLVAR